jgi:formate hydrogenlyase subunit 6/NADH:ubiquinone oxidoreductase subunit I
MDKFVKFLKSLFLLELLKGLGVTGRHMFSRKITVQYPEEKTQALRGRLSGARHHHRVGSA